MTGLTWHQPQPGTVERIARAICAEKCAFYGEPPCWKIAPDEWAARDCDEPGCRSLARAALDAAWADWMAQAGLTWATQNQTNKET